MVRLTAHAGDRLKGAITAQEQSCRSRDAGKQSNRDTQPKDPNPCIPSHLGTSLSFALIL
jgi:hypothetical protein